MHTLRVLFLRPTTSHTCHLKFADPLKLAYLNYSDLALSEYIILSFIFVLTPPTPLCTHPLHDKCQLNQPRPTPLLYQNMPSSNFAFIFHRSFITRSAHFTTAPLPGPVAPQPITIFQFCKNQRVSRPWYCLATNFQFIPYWASIFH